MEYYTECSFIRCFSLPRAHLLSSDSIDTGLLLQVLSQLSSPPATKGADRISLRDAVTHQHGAPWRIEEAMEEKAAMCDESGGGWQGPISCQSFPPDTVHCAHGQTCAAFSRAELSRNPGVTSHTFNKASPFLRTPRGQHRTGDHTGLHVTTATGFPLTEL